jgi:hypothetical protein
MVDTWVEASFSRKPRLAPYLSNLPTLENNLAGLTLLSLDRAITYYKNMT